MNFIVCEMITCLYFYWLILYTERFGIKCKYYIVNSLYIELNLLEWQVCYIQNRLYNGNNIDDICSDESSEDTADDKNNENDDKNDGEFFNVFEDYSHPTFDPANILEFPKEDQFTWILIWIMKFRSNYKLLDAATEALIKFVKLLLKECGNLNHELFPKSLYKVKQLLGLVDQFTSFAACQKCHKLYKKEDVAQDGIITKCNHIEFPNSTSKQSKKCETPLAKLVTLNNSISFRPELVYPVASIHQQLYSMFQRPGFEKSLRHWSERLIFNDILSDIYDEQVWRNFKSGEREDNFFRPD